MAAFVSVQKDGEEKMKKVSQFLKSHILRIREVILFKFGMWTTDCGGNFHSKHCRVLQRQHGTTNV